MLIGGKEIAGNCLSCPGTSGPPWVVGDPGTVVVRRVLCRHGRRRASRRWFGSSEGVPSTTVVGAPGSTDLLSRSIGWHGRAGCRPLGRRCGRSHSVLIRPATRKPFVRRSPRSARFFVDDGAGRTRGGLGVDAGDPGRPDRFAAISAPAAVDAAGCCREPPEDGQLGEPRQWSHRLAQVTDRDLQGTRAPCRGRTGLPGAPGSAPGAPSWIVIGFLYDPRGSDHIEDVHDGNETGRRTRCRCPTSPFG